MQDEHELTRLVLLRPAAEVTTKSRRTRESFMRALRSSVKDALQRADIRCIVRKSFSRIHVHTDDEGVTAAKEILPRVFGTGSFAAARRTSAPELNDIVSVGHEVFKELVAGRRFAVRAKRTGSHDFTSMDVERELGAVLAKLGKVDLTTPEVTAYVEVDNERAYHFDLNRLGPGGLPAGVSGRVVALVSGGFDSAVAAYLAMKRGLTVDYVFCNLGGDAYERQVVQVCKVLSDRWQFGSRPRLYVVGFEELLADLKANVREDFWQVVLKRLMYRAAASVARRVNAGAIVTGEALGQVSSQTLSNLAAIEGACDMLVLRPLIGFDKQEIIAKAEELGTAALSARVKEYCAISSVRPVVKSRAKEALAEESGLDLGRLDDAVKSAKAIKLRSLEAKDLILPYLYTDTVPEGAVLIDCQPEKMWRLWRAPSAVHYDPRDLIARAGRLDKAPTYVLYCPHGTVSAHAAEVMQQLGFDAYSFKGGTSGLKRYLAETGA